MARTNYLKNALKSITFTAVDVLGDLAPSIKEFAESNKDYIKQTYTSIRTPQVSARRRVSGFMASKVFEPINYIWNNAWADLKSGDFYNEKRHEADTMKAMGFGDMLEGFDDFNFDDDFKMEDEEPSLNTTVTSGDLKIVGAVEGSVQAASQATVEAVIRTAEGQAKANRMNTAMIFEQNERLFNTLRVDMSHVGGTLKAMFDLQSQVLGNMDKNLSAFQTEELKLSTERNEILKQWFEWQKEQSKTAEDRQKTEAEKRKKSAKARLTDIAYSGIPNLEEYVGSIGRKVDEALSLLNPMGEGSIIDILKTQFGAAPIRTAMSAVMKAVIPQTTKDIIKSIDNGVKSIFPAMIAAINRRAESGGFGDPGAMIASLFGLDTKYNTSVSTSKYEKGKISWDGVSRKALVEVIPGYLSRIEAHLSGNEAVLYDYNDGKWRKMSTAKQLAKEHATSYMNSAFYDINTDLQTQLLRQLTDQEKKDKEYRKELMTALEEMKEIYFEQTPKSRGPLFARSGQKKDGKAISEEENLDRLVEEIRSDYNFEIEKKYATLAKGNNLRKIIKAFRNANDATKNQLYINAMNAADAHNRYLREQEESGHSILTQLESYTKLLPAMDGKKGQLGLLGGRDEYGMTVFNYLQNINKELAWQRLNGGARGGSYRAGGFGKQGMPSFSKFTITNEDYMRDLSKIQEEQRKKEEDREYLNNIDPGFALVKALREFNGGDLFDLGADDQGKNGILTGTNAEDFKRMLVDLYKVRGDKEKFKERLKQIGNDETKPITQEDIQNIQKFFKENFVKPGIKTVTGIDKAMKYAMESGEENGRYKKKTYEMQGEESFLTKMYDRLGLSFITKGIGGFFEGFNSMLSGVAETTNKWIYDLFFTTHVDENGQKYDGFIQLLVGKAGDAFKSLGKLMDDNLITPMKRALGIDENEFKGRFKTALGGTLGGMWRIFADANKRMWFNPMMDYSIQNMGTGVRNFVRNVTPGLYREAIGRAGEDELKEKYFSEEDLNAFAREREELLAKGDEGKAEWLSKTGFDYGGSIRYKRAHLRGMGLSDDIIDAEIDKIAGHDESRIPYALDELYIKRSKELIQLKKQEAYSTQDLGGEGYNGEGLSLVTPGQAKGTPSGRPYTGLSMLTKGEIRFGRGGMSVVPKTGAYYLDNEHVLNNPDSYKLLKALGLPAEFKSVSSAEREENMVQKNLFPGHAEGTEGKEQKTFLSALRSSMGKTVSDAGKWTDEQWNTAMRNEGFNATITGIQKNVPELLAGGAVGGGVSLLLGLAGGPLVGAAVGAGSMLVKRSKTLQNILFGKIGEDGEREGGVVPKKLQQIVKKYVPDMVDYGAMGLLGSLFLPFGPVGGVLIGSTAAFVKNNESVRKSLFGKLSFGLDEETMNVIKKMIPGTVKGAILGGVSTLFGGPFGLMGNAILGGALGMVASTTNFKDQILGYVGKDGKRHGGVVGAIKGAFQPLVEAGAEFKERVMKSIDRNIFDPIKRFLNPAIHAIPQMLAIIPRRVNDWFEKGFGIGFDTVIEKWVIDPLKKSFKPISKIGAKLFDLATSPLRLLGFSGDQIRKRQIRTNNAAYMTAQERVDFMAQHGMQTDSEYAMNQALASIGQEGGMSFTEARNLRDMIQQVTDTRKSINEARKQKNVEALRTFKTFGENGVNAATIDRIKKAINAGRFEDIETILAASGMTDDQRRALMESSGLRRTIADYADLNRRWERSSNISEEAKKNMNTALQAKLKSLGIDNINLSNEHEASKFAAYLDKEIERDKRSEEELRLEEHTDENMSAMTDYVKQILDLMLTYRETGTAETLAADQATKAQLQSGSYRAASLTARMAISNTANAARIWSRLPNAIRTKIRQTGDTDKRIRLIKSIFGIDGLNFGPDTEQWFLETASIPQLESLLQLFSSSSNHALLTVLIESGYQMNIQDLTNYANYGPAALRTLRANCVEVYTAAKQDASIYRTYGGLDSILNLSGSELNRISEIGRGTPEHMQSKAHGTIRLPSFARGTIRLAHLARGNINMAAEALSAKDAIIGGGMLGAGVGKLLGHPILGSFIGAGLTFASTSKNFQDWLFGETFSNGERKDNGVISKNVQEWFKKNVPGTLKGGTLGYILGAMTGFGPIAGMAIGGMTGLVQSNEQVKEKLFGFLGFDTDEKKKKAAEKWMGAKVGAAAGYIVPLMFGGPFGVFGNVLLGSSLGMLSTTDMFKDAMFGKPDKNGNRSGGIVGGFKEAFANSITKPIANFLKPVKQGFINMARDLGDGIKSLAGSIKSFATRIGDFMPEWMKKGIGKAWHWTLGPIADKISEWTKKNGGFFKGLGKLLFHGGLGAGIGALAGGPMGALLGLGLVNAPRLFGAFGNGITKGQANKFATGKDRSASEIQEIIGVGDNPVYDYLAKLEHNDEGAKRETAKTFLEWQQKKAAGEDVSDEKYSKALSEMGLAGDTRLDNARAMSNLAEIVKGSLSLSEANESIEQEALKSLEKLTEREANSVDDIKAFLGWHKGQNPGVRLSEETLDRLQNNLSKSREERRQASVTLKGGQLDEYGNEMPHDSHGTIALKGLARGTLRKPIAHHFLGSLLGGLLGGASNLLGNLFGGGNKEKEEAQKAVAIPQTNQIVPQQPIGGATAVGGDADKPNDGRSMVYDSETGKGFLIGQDGEPILSDSDTREVINEKQKRASWREKLERAQLSAAKTMNKAFAVGKRASDGGWLTKLLLGGMLWKSGALGKLWEGFKPIWDKTLKPWFTDTLLPGISSAIGSGVEWLAKELPGLIWNGIHKIGGTVWDTVKEGMKGVWSWAFGNDNNSGAETKRKAKEMAKDKDAESQVVAYDSTTGAPLTKKDLAEQAKSGKVNAVNLQNQPIEYNAESGEISVKDTSSPWKNALNRITRGVVNTVLHPSLGMHAGNLFIRGENLATKIGSYIPILGKPVAGIVNTAMAIPGKILQSISSLRGTGVKAVKSTGWFGSLIEKITEAIKGFFNSPSVKERLNTFYTWLGRQPDAKVAEKTIEVVNKGLSEVSSKEAAEKVADHVTSKFSWGMLATIGALVWDFVTGFDKAEAILKVKDPSPAEKTVCGMVNALGNFLVFPAMIGIDRFTDWIYGIFLSEKDIEELKERRAKAEAWAKGVDDQYLTTEGVTGWLERAFSTSGRWGSYVSDWWSSSTEMANRMYDVAKNLEIDEMGKLGERGELKTHEAAALNAIHLGVKDILTNEQKANLNIKIPYAVENHFKWPATGRYSNEDFMLNEVDFISGEDRYYYYFTALKEHNAFCIEVVTRASFITGKDFLTAEPLTQEKVDALANLYRFWVETDHTVAQDQAQRYEQAMLQRHDIETLAEEYAKKDIEELKRLKVEEAKEREERHRQHLIRVEENRKVLAPYEEQTQGLASDYKKLKESGNVFGTGSRRYGRRFGRGKIAGWAKQNAPGMEKIAYQAYGDSDFQSIADSGCGPAAAVNVLQYLNGARGTRRGRFGRGLAPEQAELINASDYMSSIGAKEVDGGTKPYGIQSYLSQQGVKSHLTTGSKLAEDVLSGKPTILMGLDKSATGGFDAWSKGFKMPGLTPFDREIPHYVTSFGLNEYGGLNVLDPESPYGMLSYDPATILNSSSLGISTDTGYGTRRFGRARYGRGVAMMNRFARFGRASTTAASFDIVKWILDGINAILELPLIGSLVSIITDWISKSSFTKVCAALIEKAKTKIVPLITTILSSIPGVEYAKFIAKLTANPLVYYGGIAWDAAMGVDRASAICGVLEKDMTPLDYLAASASRVMLGMLPGGSALVMWNSTVLQAMYDWFSDGFSKKDLEARRNKAIAAWKEYKKKTNTEITFAEYMTKEFSLYGKAIAWAQECWNSLKKIFRWFGAPEEYTKEKVQERLDLWTSVGKTHTWFAGVFGRAMPMSGRGIRHAKYGRGTQEEMALQVRNYLMSQGITPNGAYAILGNMQAESGIDPQKVQTNIWPYIKKDENLKDKIKSSVDYTKAVDEKTYSRDQFITPYGDKRIGYGLVQYTFPAYKSALWERTVGAGKSIGDMRSQVDYLLHILSTEGGLKSLDAMLRDPNQRSVDVLAEQFLRRYERPANVDKEAPKRIGYANSWVQKLAGQAGEYVPDKKAETRTDTDAKAESGESALQQILGAITNVVTNMLNSYYNLPAGGLDELLYGPGGKPGAAANTTSTSEGTTAGGQAGGGENVAMGATGPVDIGPGPFALITDPTTLTNPKSRLTSPFGWRIHPVHKVRKLHKGVDLSPRANMGGKDPTGTPIKIAADGTVSFAGTSRGYGNRLIVDNGNGYQTTYNHLSSFNGLSKGMKVKAGQIGPLMGNTGIGTGAHLHFEVIKNGTHMDPFAGLAEMAKLYSKTSEGMDTKAPINNVNMSPEEASLESSINTSQGQAYSQKAEATSQKTIPSMSNEAIASTGGTTASNEAYATTQKIMGDNMPTANTSSTSTAVASTGGRGTNRLHRMMHRFGKGSLLPNIAGMKLPSLKMPELGTMLGESSGILGSLTQGIPGNIGDLLGGLNGETGKTPGFINSNNLLGGLLGGNSKLSELTSSITSKLPNISETLDGLTKGIPGGIGGLLGGLTDESGKTPGFANTNGLLGGLGGNISSGLSELTSGISNNVEQMMSGVKGSMENLGSGITGSLGSMVSNAVNGLTGAVSSAVPTQSASQTASGGADLTVTNEILMTIAKNTDSIGTIAKVLAEKGMLPAQAVSNAMTPNTASSQLTSQMMQKKASQAGMGTRQHDLQSASKLTRHADAIEEQDINKIKEMMNGVALQ